MTPAMQERIDIDAVNSFLRDLPRGLLLLGVAIGFVALAAYGAFQAIG